MKLFCVCLGGIPNMTPAEIEDQLIKNTKNVCSIYITVPDIWNRRYVLASYKSHRDTALTRRFLQTTSHIIFNTPQQVIVDWGKRHNLTLPVRNSTLFIQYYLFLLILVNLILSLLTSIKIYYYIITCC